jgi:tetratricopeptide (TPR) repeat protein
MAAAVSVAAHAAAEDVVDLGQLLSQAVEKHEAGDLEGAAALYERIVREAPDAARVRSNLGAVYARLGRYGDAIVQYREALAREENPGIRLNLAIALQKVGQFPEAAAEAARVESVTPGNREVLLLLAGCHAQMGNFAKVVELLQPLAARSGDDRAVAHLLGTALLELNRTAEAEKALDPLFRVDTPETHLLIATLHVKRKDWRKALEELERARQANPDLPLVNFLYGVCLMNESSDWAGAQAAFRRELAINPNHFEANLLLSSLLREGGKVEEALPFVERAAQLRGDDPAMKFALGAAYLALGRLTDARPLLETVADAFPKHIPTHTQLAVLYARMGLAAESQRERETVARLQKDSEAKNFQDVRDSVSGLFGPAPTPQP